MRLSFISLKWKRGQAMNIYTGLLFQQGYIQDPELALSLAKEDQPAKVEAKAAPETERPNSAKRPERGPSFRRGAIFAVCSTALSPFR